MWNMKSLLFESFGIGSLALRNRVVRSATHEGLADPSGLYTPELVRTYAQLAEKEVGLLITGHAFVSGEGRASRSQSSAESDDAIEMWKLATEQVHQHGGSILLQLAHAGGNAGNPDVALGPSAYQQSPRKNACRMASGEDLKRIVSSFAAAALRAVKGGFDGVQIHAAHGYLISEFLSPFYNRRTDEYGGSLENRMRLLKEVFLAVRDAVGPKFPILMKINSEDFVDGGFSVEECISVCLAMERCGLDAVELSGGIPEAGPARSPVRLDGNAATMETVYYETAARRLKTHLKIPLLLVGGIRSLETAARLIQDKSCDMVSLSRPLIREPDLLSRWHSEELSRSKCVSCNACFRPIMTGRGFYCPRERKNS